MCGGSYYRLQNTEYTRIQIIQTTGTPGTDKGQRTKDKEERGKRKEGQRQRLCRRVKGTQAVKARSLVLQPPLREGQLLLNPVAIGKKTHNGRG